MQFHLLNITISNKEDEDLYSSILSRIKNCFDHFNIQFEILRNNFPNCQLGNCLFHFIQNRKRKRTLRNVEFPDSIRNSREKQSYVRKQRDILSGQGHETIT